MMQDGLAVRNIIAGLRPSTIWARMDERRAMALAWRTGMTGRQRGFGICVLAASIIAAGIVGCEKKPADPQAVAAKLAKADAADGTVDKIVSKCAGCGLGMAGKKEYAATTSGYTLHFCSEQCKTDFEKDPSRAVMDMKIPG